MAGKIAFIFDFKLQGYMEKCTIEEANYNDMFLNLSSLSACVSAWILNTAHYHYKHWGALLKGLGDHF